ncbi:hypothetical protein N5D77_26750, partial [Comamonas thiooxydans]|uniref:Uncharacterized protein n=1 Tax=Pseudomonas aeruginosa TaxID=287 RepID=A0A7I8HQK3_PSEAI
MALFRVRAVGVRAGQGFGARKPKRGLCPVCGKHGMTQWRATAAGMLRWCQYCQHSEGQGVYDLRHQDSRRR